MSANHMTVSGRLYSDCDITPRDINDFLEEAIMMKDFKHENILGLIGVAIERNHSYVLLPYMDNEDIKTFISNEENVSGAIIQFFYIYILNSFFFI